MKGYGKVIVLKHTGELSTVYAHNSTNLVRMGDRVVKGQVIGRVGKTGWATGPHVHFEIRKRGVAQNPLNYLR
jgi:murein DD-endopeptidase MepM/ murein hydrolase activator NlpD